MNAHFLYLFGHLRLLEEQHSLVSLNKAGIGLIGSSTHNSWYTEAILHSQHHCELKSICSLDFPTHSASYFVRQKRKIEQLIEDDAVNTIIVTSVYSDELLKFIIQTAVNESKHILVNNVPNYGTDELTELLKLAHCNEVNICLDNALYFSPQYDEIKSLLSSKNTLNTGLLRLSAHRQIDKNDYLSHDKLRSLIASRISLLLSTLPNFKFESLSIQYSRPFSLIEDGDVLIINLKNKTGLLVSLELFFNTGNNSDKLSLKLCQHDLQFENFLISNNQNLITEENPLIIKQLDHFILNLHKTNKIVITSKLIHINTMTESILTHLKINQFV